MDGISITLEGSDAALAALNALADRLDDATPLYDELGRMLTGSTQQRFETETRPDGSPWPKSLRALFDGGKTLTDSMALRGSITWEAGPSSVAVGTNLIYAAVHQLGATIVPRNGEFLRFPLPGGGYASARSVTIPARPYLGISEEDAGAIEDIVATWLLEPVGGERSDA